MFGSADGVMDILEYTDGMHAYGFEEAQAHAAFTAFAVVSFGFF